jgi:hypothetical protein
MMSWIAALASVTLLLAAPSAARAQPVADIQAEWPRGECLQKASDPQQARFTIVGPGRIEVRLVQDPHRSAGRTLFDPVAWTNYKDTRAGDARWTGLGEAIEGRCEPPRYTQNGKAVATLSENAALDYVVVCNVGPGEHHLGVRLDPPTRKTACGWTQWAQQARVVVHFQRGGRAGRLAARGLRTNGR